MLQVLHGCMEATMLDSTETESMPKHSKSITETYRHPITGIPIVCQTLKAALSRIISNSLEATVTIL